MLRNIVKFNSIEILTLVYYSSKLLPKCNITKRPGQNAMGNLRVGGMRRQPGEYAAAGLSPAFNGVPDHS